jgi:hypothetical protein
MTQSSAQVDSVEDRVIAAFEDLPRLAAADRDLTRRGRFLTCEFEIGVGDVPLAVSVVEGQVVSVTRGPFLLKPFRFSIRAEPEDWLRFFEPMPAPGYYDLLGMNKVGRAHIAGDLVPLMGNLQYVKDLIALPRTLSMSKAIP